MLKKRELKSIMDETPTSSTGTESLSRALSHGRERLRLCSDETHALVQALKGVKGKAFIFGSRTQLDKRGGDIDLLVETDVESAYRVGQDITVRFRMRCDEKIDVFVVDPKHVDPSINVFYRGIRAEAIPFYEGV